MDQLCQAVFDQIQECGDIISSILIIYKFITDNNISIKFNADKLRGIALRSADNETSTYLWHINALIAASSDFEHLLLGIEMMFDRFLGNKQLFIKEKGKQKERQSTKPLIITTPVHKNKNNKFVGNEVISFVNSCYDHHEIQSNDDEDDNDLNEIEHKLQNVQLSKNKPSPNSLQINIQSQGQWIKNDENQNTQNSEFVDHEKIENEKNREYMNKYRGKISSPISFRMRQQKRMIQSGRRNITRKASKNTSFDSDFMEYPKNEKKIFSNDTPDILSPFNVSKFAETVDSGINPNILPFEQ